MVWKQNAHVYVCNSYELMIVSTFNVKSESEKTCKWEDMSYIMNASQAIGNGVVTRTQQTLQKRIQCIFVNFSVHKYQVWRKTVTAGAREL